MNRQEYKELLEYHQVELTSGDFARGQRDSTNLEFRIGTFAHGMRKIPEHQLKFVIE